MAVYRGMDIATAKPDQAARARVRHHGLDLASPAEEFNLRRFLETARELLARPDAKVLGIVGTPYYLHRLQEGLFEGPGADWALRATLSARGPEALHAELAGLDPEAAAAISPKDLRRLVRALEVCLATGKPFSEWQKEATSGGIAPGILLGIRRSREDLKARIDRRVDAMFAAGLVAETERLKAGGLSRSASQALGTKEVLEYLEGRSDLPATVALVKLRTRQFAKRQMTWFRRFRELRWIDVGQEEAAEAVAERLLKEVQ
jgi:tRNA dimethylallyltransferase